jgi:hypothetical protein
VDGEQQALEHDRKSYQAQMARCDRDMKRWKAAYLDDVIDLADFKTKKADVEARRASIEEELRRLDEQERLLEQTRLDTAALVEYCQRVHANLSRFDNAEKRLALEALNITVVWHHDKPLEIRGSIPVEVASNAPCYTPRRAPGRCRRC